MAIHRHILHNGEIREATEPVLRAGQVGLLSGWGVFSTIRVASGVLFAFERHWARMLRDAELLHIPMPPDSDMVRKQLVTLAEANAGDAEAPNCTLRVCVVRNSGGVWEGPGAGDSPNATQTYDLVALTANSKHWGDSAQLTVQEQGRHAACMFAGTKVLSWAMNLTWAENATRAGYDEVILLNEHGDVSECTSANIFCASGDAVFTPPLASGCLPGITRELLLSDVLKDALLADGISVSEKTLKLEDLYAADEVFITSTTRDLLAVSKIAGRGVRRLERTRLRLNRAFQNYVQKYVATRKAEPVVA